MPNEAAKGMESSINWGARLVEHLISNAAVLSVAWFGFMGEMSESEPEYVEVLQKENRELRSDLSQMQAKIVEYSIKMADLERIIGGGLEQLEEGAIFAYVGEIGRPAWCKRVEIGKDGSVVFRMAFINTAYELTYGMSASRYIGRTDFDNHSLEAAQHYYKNDLATYEARDYAEFMEPVDSANRYGGGRKQFAKFWMRIPSGSEFVCGLQVGVQVADESAVP